jgi:hypothetical protein
MLGKVSLTDDQTTHTHAAPHHHTPHHGDAAQRQRRRLQARRCRWLYGLECRAGWLGWLDRVVSLEVKVLGAMA